MENVRGYDEKTPLVQVQRAKIGHNTDIEDTGHIYVSVVTRIGVVPSGLRNPCIGFRDADGGDGIT